MSSEYSVPRDRVPASPRLLVVLLVGLAVAVAPAAGQSETPPLAEDPPPAQQEDALDLDDLLGTGGDDDEAPAEQAPRDVDPERTELERKLTGAEAREKLVQAVQQMVETADRLDHLGDTGLVTQRLQQEVISKLDVLIEFVEQQQSSGGSRSQSQAQQQQGQQPRPGAQQSNQRQGQQQQAGAQSGESMPPPRERASFSGIVDTSSPTWGSLPERVRRSLQEGFDEAFSKYYERLTESYYRRLAEETTQR